MKGPLHRFFVADHRRLDGLLRNSIAESGRIDLRQFGEFRSGILKHIGMEEKVLFLAARRARGEPLPIVARLRLDHSAIAALLVPTPTPAIVAQILSVLVPHNRREEEREASTMPATRRWVRQRPSASCSSFGRFPRSR